VLLPELKTVLVGTFPPKGTMGPKPVVIMQAIAQVNDITRQVKEDARHMVEAAAKLGV